MHDFPLEIHIDKEDSWHYINEVEFSVIPEKGYKNLESILFEMGNQALIDNIINELTKEFKDFFAKYYKSYEQNNKKDNNLNIIEIIEEKKE